MNQNITEIKIVPVKPNNGLVAFANFILAKNWYLGSIGIFTKPEGGYRLTYPTKKIANKDLQIFHPINKITGKNIEELVIKKYEEVMQNHVRYSSNSNE